MSDKPVSIQPAPAHPPQEGGGLQSGAAGAAEAFRATGPLIPDQATLNSLGAPLSKEELAKRQAELNK